MMSFSTERRSVSIWAEGGSNIGMGHIIRSIHLATALKAMDFDVNFFVNNELPVLEILRKKEMSYKIAPLEDVQSLYGEDNLVIIDSKKDIPGQVEFLKRRGRTVVLIDNITVASDLADKTILPSPFLQSVETDMQNSKVEGGPDYLIIGDNFMERRDESLRLAYSLPLKILVSMGGADPNHITEKVVKALSDVKEIELDVVLGPASKPHSSLDDIVNASGGRIKVHRDLSDLAPVVAASHVVFTALGLTVNELAFMGVPSIVIANYFDDHKDMDMLAELGIGIALGHHSDVDDSHIVAAVEDFVNNKELWESMRIKAAALTDGLGASRAAKLIAEIYNRSDTA